MLRRPFSHILCRHKDNCTMWRGEIIGDRTLDIGKVEDKNRITIKCFCTFRHTAQHFEVWRKKYWDDHALIILPPDKVNQIKYYGYHVSDALAEVEIFNVNTDRYELHLCNVRTLKSSALEIANSIDSKFYSNPLIHWTLKLNILSSVIIEDLVSIVLEYCNQEKVQFAFSLLDTSFGDFLYVKQSENCSACGRILFISTTLLLDTIRQDIRGAYLCYCCWQIAGKLIKDGHLKYIAYNINDAANSNSIDTLRNSLSSGYKGFKFVKY